MATNSSNKVMYYGREIKAYIPRGHPQIVVIDVLQKEADCPRGYTLEERSDCLCDCQNTFVSCLYDTLEKRIVGIGVLARGLISLNDDVARKHGLSIEEAQRIVIEGGKDVQYKTFPAQKDIYYKGDVLAFIRKCDFAFGDADMVTDDSELKGYIDLIMQDPKKIMKECGIEFEQRGNVEFVIYASAANRSDLPKPIIPDSI